MPDHQRFHTVFWVVLCIAFVGPTVAPAIDGTPIWLQSPVGAAGAGATISSPILAFDHNGTPAVSWSAFAGPPGTGAVSRSERSGLGLWATRPVSTGPALQTGLSFDRAERPTMVWIDNLGNVLGQGNDGITQSVGVDGANTNRPALSLAHDLAGNLRGVFAGATPGALFSISESGGSLSSASIGMLPDVSELTELRLTTDGRGLAHLIARAGLASGSEGVIIASEPSFGGDWPSTVLVGADGVNGVGIARDPTDGNIALAYTTFEFATSTSSLFYAKFDGITFNTTQVLSSTSASFGDISLAFDLSDGQPAIAFEQQVVTPAADQLMFAYLDATATWQTSLVDDTISISNAQNALRGPSLAFDDFGTSFPAIAYIDADESLVVAFDPPGVPEPSTLCLLGCGLLIMGMRRR